MIGFSIMMWFVSIVLLITAIALLRGNTSALHGKVYETTADKKGYGKALGQVVLLLAFGILCCGIVALLGTPAEGIRNAWIVLGMVIAIAVCLSVRIQRRFGQENGNAMPPESSKRISKK